MIVIKISDGFGNQLFMYACGYAVSKRNHWDLVLDTSYLQTNKLRNYELGNLNITFNKQVSVHQYKVKLFTVLERKIKRFFYFRNLNYYHQNRNINFDPGILKISDNTYLDGYWQSEKYFVDYRNDLLKLITPKSPRSKSVLDLYQKIDNTVSVAIHVRRGDYLSVGCQLEMEYYHKAIDTIHHIYPEVPLVFYVFSDDIDFCKSFFAKEYGSSSFQFCYLEYLSENHTIDDLFLMSKCQHMIIANSSYSWWAAWLNQNDNKTIICPDIGMWTGDFYPSNWIKIKC